MFNNSADTFQQSNLLKNYGRNRNDTKNIITGSISIKRDSIPDDHRHIVVVDNKDDYQQSVVEKLQFVEEAFNSRVRNQAT